MACLPVQIKRWVFMMMEKMICWSELMYGIVHLIKLAIQHVLSLIKMENVELKDLVLNPDE